MNLNYKFIVQALGLLSIIVSISMVPSMMVSAIYKENQAITAFLTTIVPTVILGYLLYSTVTPKHKQLSIRDGIIIVTLGWLISSFIGACPFVLSGSMSSFTDAFFETSSGLTTTGCSILSDIEALPKGILFWRSFTHWLGGMGILVFVVALLPSLGIGANVLASTETPGPIKDKLTAKMSDTATMLYVIYACMTVFQTILLMLFGLNLYDALTTTFATVGTGGFSSYNDSIAHFNSLPVEIIVSVFMFLAGVNFSLYFYVLQKKGGISNLLKDEEFKLYAYIAGFVALFIGLNLALTHTASSLGSSLRLSIFQTISILTTTGFATADYDVWPTFSKMLILSLMFVGGCSSSTGGGIKVIRILIIFKLIKRGIQVRLHPNAIISIKVNERKISIDTVSAIACFVFFHAIVVLISTLLISFENIDPISSFSAVLTCIGNVGPGFGAVGPAMNFGLFSPYTKILLSMIMIAGRLELFTFFLLFLPKFWSPVK